MGLSRRLAALAALMAMLLVLGANQLATTWSERSRLEDYRLETVELAHTLADYLANLEPRAQPSTLAQGLLGWSKDRIEEAHARVFLAPRDRMLAFAGASDSLMGAAPSAADLDALKRGQTTVVREEGASPGWRAAVPFRSGATPAVVEVFVSTRRLSDWAREERRRSFLLALGAAALLAFGVAALTARWVGRPLRALSLAIEAGRGGASAAPAAAEIGPTEFRGLARAYNALTGALATRERESAARAELLSLEERARGFERTALVEQTASELAHEIGTPLHTMSGNLQLLRDDLAAGAAADHPQETAERVALVLSQIERVSGVVRRGLERGAWPPPHADTLDLAEAARRMVRFLEPALAAGGVRASVLGTGAPAIGDAAFVEHIVLNLVKNAIEALPRGGTITLSAGGRDGRATLDVVDDGPGMADEVKSRLFEPYRTTKGARGTGLGLAVSRRLAEAQGGTLDLVAAARGTHWRLTLPSGDRA